MRSLFATACGAFGILLVSVSCGGGSYDGGGGNPPGPSGPPVTATEIQIVGASGPQAFNPNPATTSASGTVAWRNADGEIHRIVANDGTFDTGVIAPGASSPAIPIPAAGTRYHCSLHITMVGAVAGSAGTPPPCTGLYC